MHSKYSHANTVVSPPRQSPDSPGHYFWRWWVVGSFTLLSELTSIAAAPTVGAHALSHFPHPSGHEPLLSTTPMLTEASGSTMLVWVGRQGLSRLSPENIPTDNFGNAYGMLGPVQSYAPKWPNAGEVLYGASSIVGGAEHVVSTPMPVWEEVTMAVVEVKNGDLIQDVQYSVLPSAPLLESPSVTTTGPATLVAIWAGDGSVAYNSIPDSGFTIVEELFDPETPYIQVAVATKDVAEAGTYNVTWDASPWQGAHLWLVAVQNSALTPPTLSARPSRGRLILSWPATVTGYHLERSSYPHVEESWTSVTNVPVIVDGQNTITNGITSELLFYRLRK